MEVMRGIVLALGVLLTLALAQDQPRVTVADQGDLVGETVTFQESEFIGVNKTIDVFKGIPFAEPPVGMLRFRPPVAKAPWDGTYDATYFRDKCVQSGEAAQDESEDCLHLNIYAPRPTITGGAAVMVWIHGGAFTVGSAMDNDGTPLVAVGDVIVVTIQYRLNVFGFLTTGDDAAPGNAGLQDQVLALQWIKQNIAAFGGDSERITIFGESAGSASVNWLILSQQTAGLFNRAVMQSGTAQEPWAFEEDRGKIRRQVLSMAETLGCGTTDSAAVVSCLQSKDSSSLLTTSYLASFRTAPVVDGTFVDDTPANLYNQNRYNHAQILLGTNADEGTLFLLLNPLFGQYYDSEEAPHVSREVFHSLLTEDLKTYYGGSNDQVIDAISMGYVDSNQTDYFRPYVDYNTDSYYACGTNQVARLHADGGDDVFLYQMTHAVSVSIFSAGDVGPGWLGAGHGEDVQFVFGYPFVPEVAAARGELADDEKALSVKFMEFWTNFANTGNPGLKTNASEPESERDFWPRFNTTGMEYKILSLDLTTGRALKADVCRFLDEEIEPLLAELDSGAAAGLSVGRETIFFMATVAFLALTQFM